MGFPIKIIRIKLRAYGNESELAPNKHNISSRNTNPIMETRELTNTESRTAFPSVNNESCVRFSPSRIEIIAAAPVLISVPKAVHTFINGNETVIPEIANGPTICPTKTLSIILYNEVATVAIIVGNEYAHKSEPMLLLPNSLSTVPSTNIDAKVSIFSPQM